MTLLKQALTDADDSLKKELSFYCCLFLFDVDAVSRIWLRQKSPCMLIDVSTLPVEVGISWIRSAGMRSSTLPGLVCFLFRFVFEVDGNEFLP